MAVRFQGGKAVSAISRRPSANQDARFKKAEERLMKISDQLIALYSELSGLGVEGIRSRIADMDRQIHNIRGTLWDASNT